MKTYVILGMILLAVSLLGILGSYSISFGLSASGIFLIVCGLLAKEEKQKSQPNEGKISSIENQPAASLSFCPYCGARSEAGSPNCPSCGRKLKEP